MYLDFLDKHLYPAFPKFLAFLKFPFQLEAALGRAKAEQSYL